MSSLFRIIVSVNGHFVGETNLDTVWIKAHYWLLQ